MAKLLFLADDHYQQYCAQHLMPAFEGHQVIYALNDWSPLADPQLCQEQELLVLHMIAGTCGNPLPDERHEAQLRRWIEDARPLLLLHGSSAAFWHWPWWQDLVGWRWVRPNDPSGLPASTHPVRPYRLQRAKGRHPLIAQLQDIDLPSDEIYIELEQTCPSWILLETCTDEGTFPMAHCHQCASGSLFASFLPGHAPAVTQDPRIHRSIRCIADWLLAESAA